MKKHLVILMIMFLIPMSFTTQLLVSQTLTKEEQQAELLLQQEIDLQKKAMVEMKQTIDEQNKIIELTVPATDVTAPQSTRTIDSYVIRNQRPAGVDPAFSSQTVDRFAPGRTSWDFEKSVTLSNYTREYAIDVDNGSKNVQISISGTCTTGEIRVAIMMPGGKPYSEAIIDEFGNLNWRKSFQIAEGTTDKIGEWKFKISSKNATGNFNISLQVN